MSVVPRVKLNNGHEIPAFGLGTFASSGGDVEEAVKHAIDVGYRHIDTAYLYENEVEVGRALRSKFDEGVVKREDVFVTTKLWNIFHDPKKVQYAFQKSLDNLGLDYVDLYLIHFPFAYEHISDSYLWPKTADGTAIIRDDIDFIDTWKEMEKLVLTGKVRCIGVSNFNSAQIDRLLQYATIKPVINQVECSPHLNQRKLIAFCKERDIVVTGFSPLGRPNPELKTPAFMFDAGVQAIGDKYGKTVAQVVLRYLYELGTIVIPKSIKKARIEENINILDFKLSDEDFAYMESFNSGKRIVVGAYNGHSKFYPFHDEF